MIQRLLFALAMLAALSGCAGITDVIKQRDALYSAEPLNPPTHTGQASCCSRILRVRMGRLRSRTARHPRIR